MKLLLSVPELSTSARYVGDNEGIDTQSEHLNVKMASKIKITAHPQIIRLSVIHHTKWVKTVTF